MPIVLERAWAKLLATAAVVLLLAGYVALSWRQFRAAGYAQVAAEQPLRRAAELEPWNAAHHYRLGRYAFMLQQDHAAAIPHYRRATRLNPHEGRYWLDLAAAYQVAGDSAALRDAVRRALQANPKTPEIQWIAANLLLLDGDREGGNAVLRNLLADSRGYSRDALELAWRASGDAAFVLRKTVPPDPRVQAAWLAYMVENDQAEAAAQAWQALKSGGRPFAAQDAFPYLDYLLRKKQGAAAAVVWRDLVQADKSLQGYVAPDDAIVNGGFEQKVLNGGADWRHDPRGGVSLRVQSSEAHQGSRALAVEFDGSPSDAGIVQLVPVQPNTSYVLRAFVKSPEFAGVSGPRLAVDDMNQGSRLLLGEELGGASDWRQTSGTFTTGASTQVIALRLVREPAKTRVRGRLLLDDVSLTVAKPAF